MVGSFIHGKFQSSEMEFGSQSGPFDERSSVPGVTELNFTNFRRNKLAANDFLNKDGRWLFVSLLDELRWFIVATISLVVSQYRWKINRSSQKIFAIIVLDLHSKSLLWDALTNRRVNRRIMLSFCVESYPAKYHSHTQPSAYLLFWLRSRWPAWLLPIPPGIRFSPPWFRGSN